MTEKAEAMDRERRTLLQSLAIFFLSLWGVGLVGVVASFLKAPPSTRWAGQDIVQGGDAQSLKAGEARLIRHGTSPLYLVRLSDDEIVAVSALCTHFRCVLNWNNQNRTLACPCHNGVFSATGEVMSGLPTKPLDAYPTELLRGEILVHL